MPASAPTRPSKSATGSSRVVLHWFRRDLRLTDNTALWAAAHDGDRLVPVYILSDWQRHHAWTGPHRQSFLVGCLRSLAEDLEKGDGRLILRQGPPERELERLIRETGAAALHFNRDPDPHGRAVEEQIARLCKRLGVACIAHHDLSLHGPEEVLKGDGTPYRVFTPYSRNWLDCPKSGPQGRPRRFATPGPAELKSLPLPSNALWKIPEPEPDPGAASGGLLPEPGEAAARKRLHRALEKILPAYAERRDLPAEDGTSRLSQDLRFGLLSPRAIYQEAMAARAATRSTSAHRGIETFIKELAWREFYLAILWHFPGVLRDEFNPDWRGLPWDEPGETWEAWKTGRTGFPIVDAGMRQLLATGFMHNRVRMIVAMFLTKDLHLDWRLGEQFFMQHLIDGEIASNNGGWQWSAGTGADAAPYFRIQNPWTQTRRYDPQGHYVRRWVPELAKVPAKQLFAPPTGDRPLATGYPLPCIDHSRERTRTLAIFKKHKSQGR